jgi:hypothetical protein
MRGSFFCHVVAHMQGQQRHFVLGSHRLDVDSMLSFKAGLRETIHMLVSALIIISLASIVLADHMARARGRSPRAWFWIAFLIGPLAPLALAILGRRYDETVRQRIRILVRN